MNYRLQVPATFLADHLHRDCAYGEVKVLSTTKDNIATIECSGADVHELRSDAFHYVETGVTELGPGFLGLVSSARATLRRIDKAFTAEQLAQFEAEAGELESAKKAAWEASPEAAAAKAAQEAYLARKAQQDIDHPIMTKIPAGTTVMVDGHTFVLASASLSYTWGKGQTVRFVTGATVQATFETPDHYDYHLRIGMGVVGDRVVVVR